MWAVMDRFSSFFSLGTRGREGHCEHVGALTPVIYDASTRAVAISSTI
jgi:hypothetical protein